MWYVCVYTHTHTHTHTYTMEYYAAIQPLAAPNEILPFAITWTEPEAIMLSEISQSEKDNYHMISLIQEIRETKQKIIGKGREK